MRGTVYVFSGNGGGQLAAIVGDVDNAQFGYSVAGIGDGDGDGRDDIIAGAPFGRATATGYAAVYQGPSGALGPSVAGSAPGARMGFQVSGIGDADDDGHPDFMASEPYATTTQTEGGRVRVYRWPDTATIATVVGTAPNQHLGTALGAGGDVNGDGKPDLIVGEPEHDSARGRFRVFSGFDGSSLHTLTGQEASAALGSSVAIVGDVNRDGKADFAAGEPNASGSGAIPIRSAKGRAYIFVAPTN